MAAGNPIHGRFVGFFHFAVITSRSASFSMELFFEKDLGRENLGSLFDVQNWPKSAMNRFGFQPIGNKSSCSPRFAEQCNLPDPNPFRTVLVGTNIFTLGLRLLAMN